MAIPVYNAPMARAVVEHGFEKADRGLAVGLHRKLITAVRERPGGLYLPGGKVMIRVEGERVNRIIWKIIRGLYFLEHREVLPSSVSHVINVREPENKDPSKLDRLWNAVRGQQSQGRYQKVFAHKYLRAVEDEFVLHVWAMLWWDSIIVYCTHFDPNDSDPERPQMLRPGTA